MVQSCASFLRTFTINCSSCIVVYHCFSFQKSPFLGCSLHSTLVIALRLECLPVSQPSTSPCKSVSPFVQVVTDQLWEARQSRFPEHTPNTREYYLLRSIFEEHFPSPSALATVPKVPPIAHIARCKKRMRVQYIVNPQDLEGARALSSLDYTSSCSQHKGYLQSSLLVPRL